MAHPSAFVALFVFYIDVYIVCVRMRYGEDGTACETKGRHMSSIMWDRLSALAANAITFAQYSILLPLIFLSLINSFV